MAASKRGRPPRDLYDVISMPRDTPAQRRAADRAMAAYDRRRKAAAAQRIAKEKAAGLHPSAAQWFAARPHMVTMLCDQHGLTESHVQAAILTFDESQAYDWLYGPFGLMWSTGSLCVIESEDNRRKGGDWYGGRYGDGGVAQMGGAPDDGDAAEVVVAEHVIRKADEEVAKRCGEWRSGKYAEQPAVVSPKRTRRTKADARRAQDAARKRAARAAGKVKPRPARTRTTWQWLEQRARALETLKRKYGCSPLMPLNEAQAGALTRAADAVAKWAERVEQYGADFVWQPRAAYIAKHGSKAKPWVPLDEWIAQKKAAGKWAPDWNLAGLKKELAELRERLPISGQ